MFTRLSFGIAMFAMFTMTLFAQEQRSLNLTTQEGATGKFAFFTIDEPDPAQIITQALSLTGTQAANLQTFLDDRSKEIEIIERDIDTRRQALERALEQPNPIAFEVGTLMVSIRDLESKMKAADETLQRNVETILTAKQKATLEMIKNATAQADALRRTGLLASEPQHYQFEHQVEKEKSGWFAGAEYKVLQVK